jgi:hypothetical protein
MEPRHRTADTGDRWYRTVYDAHATPLLAYFLRRVSQNQAHDLVAEVFLIAWRRRAVAPASAGDLPANAQEVFRGDVFPDPQGYAAIYAPGLVSGMTFDG